MITLRNRSVAQRYVFSVTFACDRYLIFSIAANSACGDANKAARWLDGRGRGSPIQRSSGPGIVMKSSTTHAP